MTHMSEIMEAVKIKIKKAIPGQLILICSVLVLKKELRTFNFYIYGSFENYVVITSVLCLVYARIWAMSRYRLLIN